MGGKPLELLSAVDVAYEATRASIISGEFPPGMQLRLQGLANRYSLSLIPVREALRLLEAEGLVESIRNKGARVAPIHAADALDVCRLRLVLETTALRQAFANIDSGLIGEVRRKQAALKKIRATDEAQYLAIHRDLHFSLYERAGSMWLMRLLGLLWSHSERFRRRALVTEDPNDKRLNHSVILDALEARDLEGACGALEQHLQTAIEALEQVVKEEAGAEPVGPPMRSRR